MITIKQARASDATLLIDLAIKTFRETHEAGVPSDALEYYISTKLTADVLTKELEDEANIFYFIYAEEGAGGIFKNNLQ